MRRMLGFVFLLLALTVAACTHEPVPPGYYENDIHRGYPGPGVTDPSAV